MNIIGKYIILMVFIICLVGLGSLIAILGPNKCVRRSCIRKANFIRNCMNLEINPCDDFYKFSCDNFSKVVTYRKGGVASVLDHINYDITEVLQRLTKIPLHVTDDRILKIVKKIYQPCLDTTLISLQSVQPLWDAVWLVGGFPVVDGDQWKESDFELGHFEYKSLKNGFGSQHIFRSFIREDSKDPSKFSIYIKPPKHPNLPGNEIVTKQYTQKIHKHYDSFIVRMMFLLLNHDDYERNPVLRDTKLRFEKELGETTIFKLDLNKHQKAYWAEHDPIDIYNPMTIERIQSEFPYVEWKEFFRRMLPKSIKIHNKIIVVGSSYFKSIKDLMLKTSKRTIANFLMVENCLEASLFLPKQYFATYNKFTTQIGIPNVKRSQVCDKILRTTLNGALSSLFLETYVFTEGSQPILNAIAIGMKENMKKNIGSLEWMDEKTKEEAILKLKNTRFALSLSDDEIHELQDAENRARYFEDLCLGREVSHVLPSYFCVNKYLLNKNWELLSRKPTVFDKDIDVFSKGIAYDQKRNSLLAVYGVLKYPAFDGIWPMYMNYGGIGSVLGTAFANGFDISGSNYNYMGFKSKWWTAETEKLYNKQCECFEKEYETYARNLTRLTLIKWDSTEVSKQVSQFEGVNLAYQAYKKFLRTRFLKEQSLPGFENFTAEQLFFISYANIGCGYYRAKKLKSVLTKGNDIIYEYKVTGSLQNLQEFSEVFECKRGNKMNPEKKCKFLF